MLTQSEVYIRPNTDRPLKMGLFRELSGQIVTLENMAFVELQTYSAHPVLVCLLVFTAAVGARLLVFKVTKEQGRKGWTSSNTTKVADLKETESLFLNKHFS